MPFYRLHKSREVAVIVITQLRCDPIYAIEVCFPVSNDVWVGAGDPGARHLKSTSAKHLSPGRVLETQVPGTPALRECRAPSTF